MDFAYFHQYNKMVKRGAATPLTCGHCGSEVVVRLGAFDEPVLQCFGCNTIVTPGLLLYNEIKRQVNEYFKKDNT